MLYTFRYSPFHYDITTILRYIQPEDCLLLIEDGVLAGLEDSVPLETLLASSVPVCALKEDIAARGLGARFSSRIPCVSYADFVKLAVEHQQHFAW
ncbi:sulfurtransferase complex subunit TusB [Citrobacter sp. JGM124]|uniref:sulfurtransferase complex subunit TusB n=1 Tax=Citrobacter sp. JGM124 TaxID=2799789 RepID=UPI001BAE3868|nr:sulfurtransferase complex subunit TusB [Citrobacter sp. JGM124]MBS0848303.1 sulfurtransferase complex subunit TusB [Citrobacter sp. JGM124]